MTEKNSATSENEFNLAGQLLLAMPGIVGGSLANTVIYVCEHNSDGALGLVINKPTDITVGDLLQRIDLDISIKDNATKDAPVFFGGPVHTDRGFVLHVPGDQYSSSIDLGSMQLTTSRDILVDVSQGQGPSQLMVYLGYAGWGAGQLEDEMLSNAWLNLDANLEIIFNVPAQDRYKHALSQLGITEAMLVGDVGHA